MILLLGLKSCNVKTTLTDNKKMANYLLKINKPKDYMFYDIKNFHLKIIPNQINNGAVFQRNGKT